MMSSFFKRATSQADFDRLTETVGSVVELKSRLPAWPFRPAAGAFGQVIEYDRVLGDDFAEVLVALTRTYLDQSVATVVLGPDVQYYRTAYGTLPGFEVEAAWLEAGYGEGMRYEPRGDPTGALAYTANVIAVAGSARRWALWGQRDWEIAVLCTPHDVGPWLDTSVPVFGRDLDLDAIRSPAGWGVPLSEGERREFWRNLRLRGSGW